MASNGETENHLGHVLVRFNTLLTNNQSPIAMNDELTGVVFDYIGNILIRTDGGTTYVYSSLVYNESNNIVNSIDIGFIDFTNRNLHITNSSIAVDAASGSSSFPLTDFDGDSRSSNNLDAGADEI